MRPKRKPSNQANQAGIAISLEYLLVCTIAITLSLMAIPRFWRPPYNEAVLLKSLLQEAQLEATLRKQPVTICPSDDGIDCTVESPTGIIILKNSQNEVLRMLTLHRARVTYHPFTTFLSYQPEQRYQPFGHFEISRLGKQCRVFSNLLGRTRIE